MNEIKEDATRQLMIIPKSSLLKNGLNTGINSWINLLYTEIKTALKI